MPPFPGNGAEEMGLSSGSLSMFLLADSTNPLETCSSTCSLSKVEQKLPLAFQSGARVRGEREDRLSYVEHAVQAGKCLK